MHAAAQSHQPSITLVEDEATIPAALRDLGTGVVGVDVERADAESYFRRAALVQVGVPGRCVLIDAVVVDDLAGLDAYLDGCLAVFHAVENDIEPLAAAGVAPASIADTAVAAALLGLPPGLGSLLEELLEVRLTGDKERFQRADWEARPLTDDLMGYAARDVVHLPAMWSELVTRLEAAGRLGWYEQELAAVVDRARRPTRDWQRTRGASGLTPEQRAVVRSVWEERESIAREYDIAPQHLIHDRVLVGLATDPPSTTAALVQRARRRDPVSDHAERLLAAVARGRHAEPEEAPERQVDSWGMDAERAMRHARADVARELGIDPGVMCPSRKLRPVVQAEPESPQELSDAAGLRPWQRTLLEDVLWEAYVQARP